jgi:hypothetical protein
MHPYLASLQSLHHICFSNNLLKGLLFGKLSPDLQGKGDDGIQFQISVPVERAF